MKENKRIKIYALIALTLSVLTMSIAYAVLSTSLDIKGSATIQESSWGFELGEGISVVGKEYETTGSAVYNRPIFDGVTATYNFSLTKPGDSVTYYFDTTLQYDMFIYYFTEACINYIVGYIERKKELHEKV